MLDARTCRPCRTSLLDVVHAVKAPNNDWVRRIGAGGSCHDGPWDSAYRIQSRIVRSVPMPAHPYSTHDCRRVLTGTTLAYHEELRQQLPKRKQVAKSTIRSTS